MKLYLCMVVEGSIASILYLLLKKGFTCELPLKWKSCFLRINILLYLLPIPWFVTEIKALLRITMEKAGMTFQDGAASVVCYPDTVWGSMIIKNAMGRIIYVTGYQRCFPLILAEILLFVMLIVAWIAAYMKFSRQYKKDAVYLNDGKTKIAISSYVDSPVTIGFFRSLILLPEGRIQQGVVNHEKAHVANRDGIFRFLSYVVIAMEWYNPLCYFLLQEMIAVSEMYCDEKATKEMTKEEKADYMRYMIASAEKKTKLVTMSLGTGKELTRERMIRIMGKNQKKVMKNSLAACVVTVCFLISGIPALAYTEPIMNTYGENVNISDRNFREVDCSVFVPEGEISPYEVTVQGFSICDHVFVDQVGEIFPCNETEESHTKAACIHNYVTGTYSEHEKHSNGSCTVFTYNAKRCSKCGNVVLGSKISTVNYDVCPH